MRKGLSSLSRYIELHTDEELEQFSEDLILEATLREKHAIDEEENWLDNEFNRIFVTYTYPDVTKVHYHGYVS